jgi:histone H3/H4
MKINKNFISSHFKPNCILNNEVKIYQFIHNILSEFLFQILNILIQIAQNYKHKIIQIEDYNLAQKLIQNNKIQINVIFKTKKLNQSNIQYGGKKSNKKYEHYCKLQNIIENIIEDNNEFSIQYGGKKISINPDFSKFIKHELKIINPKMKISDETIFELEKQSIEIIEQLNYMFDEYCNRLKKTEITMKDIYDILHFL